MKQSDSKAYILLVDDETANLQLLSSILHPRGVNIALAQTGEEALTSISHRRPDPILLDVVMPEMDGFEVCRRLKADPATENIPIITHTAAALGISRRSLFRLMHKHGLL